MGTVQPTDVKERGQGGNKGKDDGVFKKYSRVCELWY